MTKNNYYILKEFLKENWKDTGMIMFNCQWDKKQKQIKPWMESEGKKGIMLQNNLSSFPIKKPYNFN